MTKFTCYVCSTPLTWGGDHGWVKKMFIDPSPANRKFPASLYDNPYLTEDGAYEANLLDTTEDDRQHLIVSNFTCSHCNSYVEVCHGDKEKRRKANVD